MNSCFISNGMLLQVQFTETPQINTVTPLSATWEGHQPWMAVSPGTPYPLPALSTPPPVSLSETRELSFLSGEAKDMYVFKLYT